MPWQGTDHDESVVIVMEKVDAQEILHIITDTGDSPVRFLSVFLARLGSLMMRQRGFNDLVPLVLGLEWTLIFF